MESNLIKVPFDVEMAKKITNGEVKGRVVTREGNNVRILCWDKKDKTYHIAALVMMGMRRILKLIQMKECGTQIRLVQL